MKQLSISFILILFSFYVAANEQEIRNSLKNILPDGAQIESIKKTAIEGLYEVYYGDLEPIYVNEDGSFFIYGDIYKINTNSITNITDQSINKNREAILNGLPEDEFISFKSSKEEFSVIVFTDV
ncbi:MAG: thioredoxin, partial [Proteobacteria bacterium]|nr:thioredoxin [Pseudomonadota bacterium]